MSDKKEEMKDQVQDDLQEEVSNDAEATDETEASAETRENPGEETEEASNENEDKADRKSRKADRKADKKTEKLQEQIDDLQDRVKRQLAEFENYRRRTEVEKAAMFEVGAKSVIEKILPVIDNFERGLATVPEEEKNSPFAEGMNMIYKQLMVELEKLEVKPIEAVGAEFNPELHNAVMQVESEELETGMVAQELQKGYTYRGTVVRHSMVAVVQ
ncbi:MAG: nucleotide exchange factor GrpE [Lachnospiraceae bacterium]